MSTIAEQIGYESEAAFNRAFKREFGLPPSSWRKEHMQQNAEAVESTADEK